MRQRDLGRAWRRGLAALATLVVAIAAAPAPVPEGGGGLALRLRSRVEAPDAGGLFRVVERPVSWEPRETAIIVCDMWDSHHCLNAVRRVKEMGPTMDRVLRAARSRGALIIHAPSDCMAAYKDHPARKRALETPRAKDLPRDIAQWCRVIPSEEKGKYPIDQADGGEDDDPAEHKRWADELSAMGRNPRLPWRAQTDLLAIDAEADVISDKGEEVWSVLEHRGIKNVILLGVHLNMCVLGRPFGLRQLAKNGKNVALMRDMTDTMYNPARSPHVSHFAGTDLMVEHVEKFVCPTLTSDQLLGGLPFRFHGDARPHAALILDEDEYRTEATVPEFASTHLTKDYFVSFVLGDPRNRDDLLGVGILDAADLALVSVRRRVLPRGQLEAVRKFVASGKPVVGIRTASHAFAPRGNEPVPEGRAAWTGFDAEVLGGNYHGHLGVGPKTTIREAPGAASHPILKGVDPAKLTGHGSLYKVSPLAKSTTPLLLGTVPGQPAEPIAWVNAPTSGNRVFTTSLGHIDDFKDPEFARLLKNAIDWAARPAPSPAQAPAAEKAGAVPGSRDGKRGPLGPRESLRTFAVPDDLEVELVLSEPEITQPVFLNFDERGRMWVVEYRQYPEPAGLTILSRDKYWRAVYDKVPQAPPHHVRGRDRITIHEDSDGDGTFDRHSTFVDGLNIATACARGRGGVWVLNPPFLLFYPDRNDDDVPDGDPVVHLSGFGLEDTHSVVNSLRWGPDGWLYAAQGSTVTGDVVRPGLDRTPRHTLGQLIWRYHPESRRYEVFAEGGGNAFGVEIDAKGRVYSGHNGGDTRGFHYVQGGYYRKGFEKHGALSNPYAFGYFPSMTHPKAQRFSHTFLIDDDRALPGPYRGRLFAVEPLLSRVVFSAIEPEGSTFRTHDLGFAVSSRDPWFRPVDIKVGPEGAIYIADWYDGHLSHLLNREGQLDRDNGRIYRLKAKGARPSHAPDLARATSEELVGVLGSGGPWARQSALRLLGDRKDATVVARLRRMALEGQGQAALEGLWALNLCGGLDEPAVLAALDHADPYVRSWTVRLLGDEGKVSPAVASKLEELARIERNVEVRSQLACSAKRLPAGPGLAIVAKLLAHDEDVKDPHLPLLLWWAIEARCEDHRDAVLALFRDPAA